MVRDREDVPFSDMTLPGKVRPELWPPWTLLPRLTGPGPQHMSQTSQKGRRSSCSAQPAHSSLTRRLPTWHLCPGFVSRSS